MNFFIYFFLRCALINHLGYSSLNNAIFHLKNRPSLFNSNQCLMSTLDLGYSKTLTQEVLSRCLHLETFWCFVKFSWNVT